MRLRNLHPLCVPDLPPYVYLDCVTGNELQEVVVRATRSFHKFKTGDLGGKPFLKIAGKLKKK